MKRYRIAFHVQVEVEAVDPMDAIHIANMACRWPGDYQPPTSPIDHQTPDGVYSVAVRRSQALMIKELS